MIEQVYTYSFRKDIWKTNIRIENQGIKQVEALKVLQQEPNQQVLTSTEGLFPNEMRTNKIRNWGKKVNGNNIKYETSKCIYGFQQFKMIRSFGGSIISGNSEWQSSNKNICKSNIK